MKRILALLLVLSVSSVSFGGFWAELEMFKDDLPTLAEMEYIKANTKIPGFKQELDAMIKAVRAGYESQYWFDLDVDIDDPDSVARVELITPDDDRINFDWVDTYDFDIEKGYFTVDQMKADFPPGPYTIQVIHLDGTLESKTFTLQSYTDSDYPDFVDGSLSWEGNYLNLHFSSVPDVSHYEIEAVTIKDDVDLWGNDSFYLSYPGETTITFDNNIEKGLYDCDIDVSAKRDFGGGDVDVWIISCKNWFCFNKSLPTYENKATKCTVNAGVNNKDSISFSGRLGAAEEDFIFADAIRMELSADAMADPKVFTFPINTSSLKNSKYSCAGTDDENIYSQFKYDSKTHVFAFSSKGLDLTGLACPITVTITIGDYEAELELTETIVNGTKPCPSILMMGVWNNLDVTKFAYKRGKAAGTDTLSAQGTFSVAGNILLNNPFVLSLGSQSFTVAGNQFTYRNGVVTCTNAAVQEGGLASVKLDTNKGVFSIAVKNVSITNFGVVAFNLNLSGFPLSSIDFETVNLGDPFVGTRTMTLYGNNNISEGFTLDEKEICKPVITTSNGVDYVIKGRGVTFSMIKKSANQLALNPQPQINPNVYMLSDGTNGAFVLTGQENYNPLDISVRVSTWTRPAVITGAQLAGQWNTTWIYDNNLMVDVLKPFETADGTFAITDLGNNQVKLDLGGGINWVLNIVGTSLVPTGPQAFLNSRIAHFSMVTDGNGIAITWIGVDTNDSTVISTKIGLAAR